MTNTRCRRAIYLAGGWVGDHLRDALQGIRHGHWYLEGQSVAALPGTYRDPGRPGPTLSFGTPTPCTCAELHGVCCVLNVAGSMLPIVRCACVACCIFTPSGPVGGNWHPVQVEPHCSAHGLEPHVWEQRPLRSTSAQLPKPVSNKNTCKAHMPSAAVGVPQGDLASACFLESLVPSVRLASQGLAGAGEVPEEQRGPCGSKCGQSRCRCGRVEPDPPRMR